jgi:hypothetical protein
MADTRKPKAQTTSQRRRRTTKPAEPQAAMPSQATWKALTPDRLHRAWQLHHPGRPEVRGMLERLYRQRY